MTVSLANISADCGEVYDAADGGTTAVTSLIVRAGSFIKLQTGTTLGYDAIVRPLTDAMLVTQVMGGVDPVNKTIGSLSVGAKDLKGMRAYFEKEAKVAAVISGVSLDGLTILMKDSAQ